MLAKGNNGQREGVRLPIPKSRATRYLFLLRSVSPQSFADQPVKKGDSIVEFVAASHKSCATEIERAGKR